jgi:F-type H+-transporting ATPase subunit c
MLLAEAFASLGAGIAMGAAGFGAALGIGIAVAKAVEAIARQPEAEKRVRTLLILGIAFIETIAIYAILICILLIFVA